MTVSRSRLVAVLLIVVSFVALAAYALFARAYEPSRDAVNVPQSLGLTTPKTVLPIASSSPISTDVLSGILDGGKGNDQVTLPPGVVEPQPLNPSAPSTPDNGGTVQMAACELGLATPTTPAGLANLVPIVPLFGPFSPEAFTFVPAFEPGFPLLGPLIIAGGEFLTQAQPALDALVPVVNGLEEQGFNTIAPFYGPVRPQFLSAEAQLASLIAPGVAAFASLPGATCVPAALDLLF